MLMKALTSFWDWITGKTATRRMLDEFVRRFPGRCPICSHHRYGLRHGHTSDPEPPPHDCIERKDAAPHLERCPFCGEERRVTLWEAEVEGRSIWCVFCEACEAEGPHKTTAEVAASGWNTRMA